MIVNFRPGAGKALEFRVGEDGVILYHEATVRDRDAARHAAFGALQNATEGDRWAEYISALLGRCVTGWAGFVDASGAELPFSRAIVDEVLAALGVRDELLNKVLGVGGAPHDPLPETASGSTSGSAAKKGSSRKRATGAIRN